MNHSLRLVKYFALSALLTFGHASNLRADQLSDAMRAYNAGDFARAATLYKPLADNGNAVAQYHMGMLYSQGLTLEPDYPVALQWFMMAADANNADAQRELGQMYQAGRGVRQNYKQAIKWFRLAAEQDNANAQFQMGQMSAAGTGIPKDFKLAEYWYRKAASQGNAAAQYELALCNLNGSCGERNEDAALAWLDLATGNAVDATSREKYAVLRDQTAGQIASRQPVPVATIDGPRVEPAQVPVATKSDEKLVLSNTEPNVDKVTEPAAEITQTLPEKMQTADAPKSDDQPVLPMPASMVHDESAQTKEQPATPVVDNAVHEEPHTSVMARDSDQEVQANVTQEDEQSADSVSDDMSVEPVQDELAHFAIENDPGKDESGPSEDKSKEEHTTEKVEDQPPLNSTNDTEQVKDVL
jgi:hypothetical protein